MQKINLSDIKNILEYEKIRNDFRKEIIKIKKVRRLAIGNVITFVFENRETVLFQIQEMVRAERMIDEKAIQHEIDIYNQLIPEKNQLKVTMLVEITSKEKIKPVLDSFVGMNKDCIFLNIDKIQLKPSFDEGQFEDNRISAVQYLTFNFNDQEIKLLSDKTKKAEIEINHQNYKAKVELPDELRTILLNEMGTE